MLKTQSQQLKNLIAKGHLDKALEYLNDYTKSLADQDYYNSLTQLSARWKTNERAQHLGTLSTSDYNLERNKINQAVLTLLDELVDHTAGPKIADIPIPIPPANTTDLWKKIGYIGLILGILASMVKIIEFCNRPSTPPDDAMQLTVYVQDVAGKPIPALQNVGHVKVIFGDDLRYFVIGENGRSNIGEIPTKFRGQEREVTLVADGYEPVFPGKKYKMGSDPVVLVVQRDNSLGTIQGIVKDRSGEKFIQGALVMIDQDTTLTTDTLGRFKLVLPLDRQRDTYTLTVKKEGYKVKSEYFKPMTGGIEIRLDK